MKKAKHPYEKIVYLLQGGGALGAYQVGVCEMLMRHGFSPDWVIGTSIGGINAAIIAGNRPEDRMSKLTTFWERITSPLPDPYSPVNNTHFNQLKHIWHSLGVLCFGVPGFFSPRWQNPWLALSSTPDKISFYDTAALKKTLENVIDFNIVNAQKTRLTLNAVNVESGELTVFDNTEQAIDVRHVMASGALPPGFPGIEIDGQTYWDGGLSSNTPLFNVVSQDKLANEILCFMIDLFSNCSPAPQNMAAVLNRKKDLAYADRYQQMIAYFCEVHRLRHALRQVKAYHQHHDVDYSISDKIHLGPARSLNIIRFLYKDKSDEIWSKDFEFSKRAIQLHWQTGNEDAQKALDSRCWENMVPDIDSGLSLNEF